MYAILEYILCIYLQYLFIVYLYAHTATILLNNQHLLLLVVFYYLFRFLYDPTSSLVFSRASLSGVIRVTSQHLLYIASGNQASTRDQGELCLVREL